MKKELIIIAGPNGSGKSTLASQLELTCDFINADYCESKFFSHIADKTEREKLATLKVADAIKKSLENNISFAFETVFAIDQIPSFLHKAKSQGYEIILHYISTASTDINISRVAKRVSEGGHDIPTPKIIERYAKTMRILSRLLDFADTAFLYDNSGISLDPFLVKENNEIKIIGSLPEWAKHLG